MLCLICLQALICVGLQSMDMFSVTEPPESPLTPRKVARKLGRDSCHSGRLTQVCAGTTVTVTFMNP